MKITLTEEQLRELISNHLPEMARAQHDTNYHRWYLDISNNTIHEYEYCDRNSWQQNDDYIQIFAAGAVYCNCDWCMDDDSDVGQDYDTLCAIEEQIIDELKADGIKLAAEDEEPELLGLSTSVWAAALAHCSDHAWALTSEISESGDCVKVVDNKTGLFAWMQISADKKWITFNKKSFKVN